MPKARATVGQLLVNEVLPSDMRDYNRVLDKKGLSKLLAEVAEKHPGKYRAISHDLGKIGRQAAYTSGGNSFGLTHMRRAKSGIKRRVALNRKLDALLDDDNLDDNNREQNIIKLVGTMMSEQQQEIFDESLVEKNPLAEQLAGAGRGNKMNLASLRGSDGLYQDHRDKIIPVPVLRSYAQGLSPAEYWAGTYGARQGVMAVKFATQDAGFLSKQLNQITHRSLITALDADGEPATLQGLPVDTDDMDSEGALLAMPFGDYKRNTVLTPKILRELRKKGIKRILIRSPAVGGTADGGVYARDAGVREFGRLPVRGENVGLTAAQALSEPISQGQLSAKHTGGVAGESKAVSGFDYINQLVQVPKAFKGGAAHATVDGTVQSVMPAPAGGNYVTIEGERHYVAAGYEVKAKRGDKIEAGDVISEGTPNPALITQYKGVGEGRRYFIKAFGEAISDAGMSSHRRNVELLARGLINHVRLTDEIGDYAPDDVVPYSMLAATYKPRRGFKASLPAASIGKYLERPYLHYSIGTKIRPSMLADFKDFGIKSVDVHEDAPPFEPEMIRGMANLQHDPDWMTRMFGSGLKGGLLKGVHRGSTADETGTSFVAGRAKAVDFGRTGTVQQPKVGP
jgi:DNA-directed RNA polymerase subunit beta'